MWNRNFIFAGILFASLLLGGNSNSGTFVRFQVEGQTYEVKNPIFIVTRMVANTHFLDLNYVTKPLVPGAIVQWRMKLKSLEPLAGENLHLKTMDPNHLDPTVIFRIDRDLSIRSRNFSNIHVRIDRIGEDFIEGSFSGKDLLYSSRTKKLARKVDVTAQFRAKLIRKTISN